MKNIKIYLFAVTLSTFFLWACEEEKPRPESIETEVDVQNASSYNAADGSISVNIIKGDPPYIFHWNTGDSTESISGLTAGDYTYRVLYGENGSSVHEQTLTIAQPDPEPLQLNFNVTDATVYDKPLGAVSVEAEGGVPPYTFVWSNGETAASLENLFAGTYSVTVTDSGVPYNIVTTGSVTVGQPEFVCGQDSIRDIDGNFYSTVLIGDQCWTGENLKTIHRPDSPMEELIPIDGRICRGLFCEQIEGAHYNWTGMMNGSEAPADPEELVQGICPTGWHIPSRDEFTELDQYLSVDGNGGTGFFSGAKMKGEGSSSGFDAIPAGNWGYGIYNNAPYASFWTKTELATNAQRAHVFYVTDDTPFLNSAHQNKENGFNVRCIKD